MSIFEKFFCCHVWKSHVKEVYEWDETKPVDGTKHWFAPRYEKYHFSETVEILICEKCGKIEKITY